MARPPYKYGVSLCAGSAILSGKAFKPACLHAMEETMSSCDSQQSRMYSPGLDLMMKEVARTLGQIDFEHQVELDNVEESDSSKELKQYISERLRAAHRERRQPYVELLNQLWMQQRGQSFAA
jgi:hypothetical protein